MRKGYRFKGRSRTRDRLGQPMPASVRRLLLEKFRLGLFDQRHVDVDAAAAIVGRTGFVDAGLDAQRASYTLLTNRDEILPLSAGLKVYDEGLDAEELVQHPTSRSTRFGAV